MNMGIVSFADVLNFFHSCFAIFSIEIFYLLGEVWSWLYWFLVAMQDSIVVLISFSDILLWVCENIAYFVCWSHILEFTVFVHYL